FVVPGNGDGSFATGRVVSIPMNGPYGGAIADFNGDGRNDIAVANHQGGTFTFATDRALDGAQANDAAAADINHDGKLDLVVAWDHVGVDGFTFQDGGVNVYFGNGDGTFGPGQLYPTTRGAWRVVTGDFNRDGVLDIA